MVADRKEQVPAPSRPSLSEWVGALPWQVRLLLLAAVWGSSFLLIKIGDQALAPVQVAFARLLFGSATLLLILLAERQPWPRGVRLWFHLAMSALLFNSLPFLFFAYGEERTTSVLAGIWNATTPLFTLVFSMAALSSERPTRQRAMGLLVGFLGVLVVLGVWNGVGGRQMTGNLLCMGAAVCYGMGFPYMRRFVAGRPESPVTLVTGQILCGMVELLVVMPFISSAPHSVSVKVILSMLALGALGTGIAYILNYSILRDAGPTLASTVTYIVPLFSTLEGMIFLGEPLAWYEPVGAVVVILGVALSQGVVPTQLLSRSRLRRAR